MSRAKLGLGLLGLGLATFAAVPDSAVAGSYSVLYEFKGGGNNDGALPFAAVIKDGSGNLYGTTAEGGEGNNDGTVFKVAPNGTETVLHAFTGCSDFLDGCQPRGKLLLDKKGNLYGTTYSGGGSLGGTVFKISASGKQKVLYAFTGNADGSLPAAGLIKDSAGNLYGTGAAGGNGGQGVVFKVSPTGNETVLYSFTGGADGGTPIGDLIADSSGNLYGTTYYGGAGSACIANCGVVFKVDSNGNETVLYAFQGGNDGAYPAAGLVRDSAGNFYGTTEYGGGPGCFEGTGCGTVFKLTPGGTETVVYSFTGGADGGYPSSNLVEDNGAVYGTTTSYGGGCGNCGTVFKVTSRGVVSTLHAFVGASAGDGSMPKAGLLKVGKILYGTTSEGGNGQSNGVVFKIAK